MISPIDILPQPVPATDGTPADRQTDKPRAGQETLAQTTYGGLPGAYGLLGPNGGLCSNPCGFPGYGGLYLGHYWTYDWMIEMPTIAHARSMAMDPLISAAPSFDSLPDRQSKKRLDFIKGIVENWWAETIGDILRFMDYGVTPFEKVWGITGSRYELDWLKPLDVNRNQIVADKGGRFAGLDIGGGQDNRLGVHKSAIFTYDRKFGGLYGRSRLENMRATAWRDWLDASTDLQKLCKKISGKLGILYTPPGSFALPGGGTMKWSDLAATVGALLTSDASLLHLTHLGTNSPTGTGTSQQNIEAFVAAVKASAVRLEMQDFGSNAPAIGSLLDRMKHDEELMFAGYYQSPRTGMATVGGTKADAQQHTDTATLNAENVGTVIAAQFNRQVIDDILVLNFGESARGSVWMKPPKLTDDNVTADMAILNGIFLNPDGLATSFLEQININPMLDRRGIEHDADVVLDALETDPGDDTMPGDENDATDTLAGDNGNGN